jgi:hypothetical protein
VHAAKRTSGSTNWDLAKCGGYYWWAQTLRGSSYHQGFSTPSGYLAKYLDDYLD